MRTRLLSKCTNQEVEDYLDRNDIVFIAVGSVEMHGGMPLDCEAVLSEAIALRLAEKVDGLVLGNLGYLYAGATVSGRGTVQVSVRESIDYLYEISRSLYRQGFRRQVYTSLHGPSHVFVSPVIRDFFDAFQTPMLYIDGMMPMMRVEALRNAFATDADPFTDLIVAAYDALGRLEDVPVTTADIDCSEHKPNTTAFLAPLQALAPQSGAIGNYFGEHSDHRPTKRITSEEHRAEIAAVGREYLDAIANAVDIEDAVARMRDLDAFTNEVVQRFPSTLRPS